MLIVIAFLVILIPSGAILTTTDNYFSIINFAYGQTNQTNSNNANSLNIQNIPVKKAHVGDIDIAYKTFGKGEPFLLIGGLGAKMDSWEPSILKNLSTNHTVIVFDNRGVGNTTTGTKLFSVQQFVNDTNGLLNALKIQKADVLGHSMGSFVAQQLAVTHPEKVNRLILVAASCGGKESIPPSPQAVQLGSEMIKNATNNVPISNVRTITSLNQGSAWMKSHPNFLQGVPEHLNFSELISVPLNQHGQKVCESQSTPTSANQVHHQ